MSESLSGPMESRAATRSAVLLRDHDDLVGYAALRSEMEDEGVSFLPSRQFEDMYDPNPRLVVLFEKHGTTTFLCDGPDRFGETMLSVLRSRVEDGFWYEEGLPVPDAASALTDVQEAWLRSERWGSELAALPWDSDSRPVQAFWAGKGNPWRSAVEKATANLGRDGLVAVAADPSWNARMRFLALLALRDEERLGLGSTLGRVFGREGEDPFLVLVARNFLNFSAADEARLILQRADLALSEGQRAAWRGWARKAQAFLSSRRDHQYERMDVERPARVDVPAPASTVSLEATLEFVREKHGATTDWSGLPYWHHPVWVMNRLPEWADDETRRVALLHDVVEDCGVTADELRGMGFSPRVVEAVLLLTREDNAVGSASYFPYVERIASSGNRDACAVKLCDNLHNLLPERFESLDEERKGVSLRLRPLYRYSVGRMCEALGLRAPPPPGPTRSLDTNPKEAPR